MPNYRLPPISDQVLSEIDALGLPDRPDRDKDNRRTANWLRNDGYFVAESPTEAASMLKALGYVVIEPLAVDSWRYVDGHCPLCYEEAVTQ